MNKAVRWWWGVLASIGLVFLVIVTSTSISRVAVAAGVHDTWYVRQWYDPEQIGTTMMRWSEPDATLRLPVWRAGWQIAEVWLLNGRPNGVPAQSVTVTVAQARPLDITVQGWQLRRYALLWHAPATWWQTPLHIHTTTPIVTSEQRTVGVLLAQWRVTPTTHTQWISPYLLVIWLVTAAAGWGVMRLSDITPRWLTGVLPALLVGALALAMMLRPAETLPWVHWPAAMCVLALVWQSWARLMGWVIPTTAGRLGVDGRLLAVLCGSAWCVMPWLQYLLMRDGIRVLGFAIFPDTVLKSVSIALLATTAVALLGRWRGWVWWPWLTQWAVLAICGVLALVYSSIQWDALTHVGSADFDVWVIAARHWLATGSLYDVPQIASDVFGYVYKYPPLYGMLFIPLAPYDEMTLLRIYRVIDIGLLLSTAAIWLHIIKPRQWVWWALALIVCANLNPVFETLKYGQIDIVVVWLCSVLYWCYYHEHDEWAGGIVAFLISIKMYPAVLLIWFVLQRRWRVVSSTIVAGVLLNLVGMVVLGWHDYVTFVFEVLPIIGGTTAYVENQTVAAFMARFVAPSYPLAPFSHPVWAPLTTVVSVLVLAGLFVVCAKQFPRRHSLSAVQFAIVVMMTALAIPVAWVGYQVPLWLVFIVALWYAAPRVMPWHQASIVAASFAVIGFGNFLSFVFALDVGWVSVLTDSYKLYGMLALTAVLCVWVWHTPTPTSEPTV